MRKRLIAAAAMVCAASAWAAEPLDTLRTYELQDVQVTSTRASRKTPVAYRDVSKEELSRVNFGQDIPYLLSLTPSVTTTSDAGNGIGYTSIRVRGVDPSRINITANGIPLNDAESGQVYWVNGRLRQQRAEHADTARSGHQHQRLGCFRRYHQHADGQPADHALLAA